RVGRIGNRGTAAGALLDEDLEPGGGQLAERFGDQGDAPLAGRGLPGDADLHGHHLMSCSQIDDGVRMGRWKDTDRRPRAWAITGCGSVAGLWGRPASRPMHGERALRRTAAVYVAGLPSDGAKRRRSALF